MGALMGTMTAGTGSAIGGLSSTASVVGDALATTGSAVASGAEALGSGAATLAGETAGLAGQAGSAIANGAEAVGSAVAKGAESVGKAVTGGGKTTTPPLESNVLSSVQKGGLTGSSSSSVMQNIGDISKMQAPSKGVLNAFADKGMEYASNMIPGKKIYDAMMSDSKTKGYDVTKAVLDTVDSGGGRSPYAYSQSPNPVPFLSFGDILNQQGG